MNNLEADLQDAFFRLERKLSHARTIPMRYEMMEEHRRFLIHQSVMSIYAAWEGFLKSALQLYLNALNKLGICYDELSDEYLAYQTDSICSFKNSKTNWKVIERISVRLLETYKGMVSFDTSINTESNANLKVTNGLLRKLSLEELSISKDHENLLDKLLRLRNSIAHGNDIIGVKQKNLDEFRLLVQNLAADFILSILDGFVNRVYLKTAWNTNIPVEREGVRISFKRQKPKYNLRKYP
uniref:RiboL-PSP-HEPN domain-containing protein n=1 Tax=Candidatus Kentrum sp. TUN TaxID=2126343 RepID=A0A450Z9A1_9GAMM|nr:MAG: hypothetical protein BECKTUN1418E_GA0071001_100261 [Candidatus Kentron sp. TUN]VFK51549.1 MAG: hypothetical protein BECKTUN1418F_GA0071002_100259 [Candidatus Kentron sp. TUN]VFK55972.1 MAG: hypothetical protein BECKTUN1418D_GA0071000_10394 [Candidatus Kentron sp. TUN]